LVRQDGSALAVNDVKAGVLYRIWYDGANMRVVEAGLTGSSGGGSISTGNPASTRGLFASRSACGTGQTGSTFYSTDIAHFSHCDGASWADYYQGMPVTLPSSTAFTTLNGTGATITTNGISAISAAPTSANNLIGREMPAPAAPWTIVAWLESADQGVVNANTPSQLIYVRDADNKILAWGIR
jgi:hypothetical protein